MERKGGEVERPMALDALTVAVYFVAATWTWRREASLPPEMPGSPLESALVIRRYPRPGMSPARAGERPFARRGPGHSMPLPQRLQHVSDRGRGLGGRDGAPVREQLTNGSCGSWA